MSGVWVFEDGIVRRADSDPPSGAGAGGSRPNNKVLVHVPSGEVVTSYDVLERRLRELGWEVTTSPLGTCTSTLFGRDPPAPAPLGGSLSARRTIPSSNTHTPDMASFLLQEIASGGSIIGCAGSRRWGWAFIQLRGDGGGGC